MKLTIRSAQGKIQDEHEICFPIVENGKGSQAVHDVVVAYRAAQRNGTACTKTMGQVAGTGKKPWRQKGTGRARAGSFASPIWVGGGVVFGPKPRSYNKKINKTTRQLALRKALSERIKAGDVILVDEIKMVTPKTKNFIKLLSALEINGTALVVTEHSDTNLDLASRNVAKTQLSTGDSLTTYQVLRADKLVFTHAAFQKIEDRLKQD